MKKIKLLVVDDNSVFRQMLIEKFSAPDMEILLAEDGSQALDVAFKDRPDAILLDVGLPVLTGFDVCRQLRDNPITQDIPIIMLTVRDQLDDRMRGLRCGADAYLTKPVDLAWLGNRLHALLSKP